MTTSQSPTHPDAPRAGGETPRWLEALDDAIGTADAEANDVTQKARFRSAGRDTAAALRELRASLLDRPAPSVDRELPDTLRHFGRGAKRRGVTSDLNEDARWFAELHAFVDMAALEIESLRALLARHRDGERETVCGMRFVVDRTIPPGEIHMRQDGRVVARLINVTDGEVAVGSAPPSPERASK